MSKSGQPATKADQGGQRVEKTPATTADSKAADKTTKGAQMPPKKGDGTPK